MIVLNREKMLTELKNIDLRAIPTVATMDMGLQYDYATSEGAGTGFGGMGDWPAHKFMPIRKERWLRIREGKKNNSLTAADLEGTGLDIFLEKFNTINYEVIPSEALKGLLNLSEELSGPFYCFFDDGLWYDEHAERPVFFTSEKELKAEFISRFVDDLTKWEEMDDEELTQWYERLQDEMAEFAVCVYDSEE